MQNRWQQLKKMKNNWTITSIGTGILGGLLSHLIVKDWRVNLLVALIVTIGMLINNPQKRYMRAFWVLLSMFFVLNRFFFKLVGSISDINFEFGSNEIHWIVSIALLILAGSCLRLDYLERNEIKQNLGSFFNIRINSPDVSGDLVNQGANSVVNKIIVNGDYIESGDKRRKINQFDEVERLLNREEELVDLINNLPPNETAKINKHQNELDELRKETANFPEKITELANKINSLRILQPAKAIQATEELFKGYYGSAKDILFDIQQERGDKEIAKKLGITYDELIELDYEVEDGHTSNDGMIYYYILKFNQDSPKEIIEKIEGVTKGFNGYELEVEPSFFNDKDDFE